MQRSTVETKAEERLGLFKVSVNSGNLWNLNKNFSPGNTRIQISHAARTKMTRRTLRKFQLACVSSARMHKTPQNFCHAQDNVILISAGNGDAIIRATLQNNSYLLLMGETYKCNLHNLANITL